MNEFRERLAVWSGMIGSLLFLAVFVAEDGFSPGFNWLSTAVSEHSRTPHGWIQITTFIVVGLLFVIFSGGISEELRNVPGSRTGPLMIGITGVCLILSGPFVTDHPRWCSDGLVRGNLARRNARHRWRNRLHTHAAELFGVLSLLAKPTRMELVCQVVADSMLHHHFWNRAPEARPVRRHARPTRSLSAPPISRLLRLDICARS